MPVHVYKRPAGRRASSADHLVSQVPEPEEASNDHVPVLSEEEKFNEEEPANVEKPKAEAESAEEDCDVDLPDVSDLDLNQKVALFRKYVTQQATASPAKLLNNMFTKDEMSALWSRLRTAVKGASDTVQENWSKICTLNMREGKNEKKNHTLALTLAFPSTWQERFIKDVVRVSSKESKGSDIRWYYRGELEQIHGPQEAAEFIAKGKYIEGNDEQGDIIYRKAQKMESVIHSYERVAETERRAKVDEEGLEKNLECMQQWFNEAGFSSAGSSTGAVLDGHGGGNGSKDSKVAVISNKRGNVTKNPLSKRGLSGLLDGENEGAPPKKQKSEEEDAKAKGQHMVNHLSNTSAKLLATIDKIVPSKAAASIILLAKEKQKELERMRGVVLKASSDTKKFNVEELKRLCVKGAAEIKEAMELMRVAKPHLPQPAAKPASKSKAEA